MKLTGYSQVRVRLTETGVKILNDRDGAMTLRLAPCEMRRSIFNTIATRKAGDEHRASLWDLMNDFGPHLVPGARLPFEDFEIEIVTHEVRRAEAERDLKRRMYRV